MQERTDDGQAELRSHAEPHVLRRRGDDLDSSGGPRKSIRQISSPPIDNLTDELADPIGQWTFETPLGCRFGNKFEAGFIDHQPDAAELPACRRPPAQKAEMKTAGRLDHESRHG